MPEHIDWDAIDAERERRTGVSSASGRPGDQAGERSEPVGSAASDQQQAAEVWAFAHDAPYSREAIVHIARALAAARAEEAARWRAKIEALAAEFESVPYHLPRYMVVERIREALR